jgi:hypothetical protein
MWTGCDHNVNPPSVFDHTALVALFNGHPEAFALWEEADRGETQMVMPAVAVAEANHLIGTDHNAWTALLFPADVTVAPLDSSQAIDIGACPGGLVARHVVYEAHAVEGVIVTQAPWQYTEGDGPMRVI